MIPGEVLADPRLSHRDVRVYGLLTCCRRGCYVSIGRARLAKLAHADRRGIRASVKALVETGHVAEAQEGRQRARFKLLSVWFVGKSAEVGVEAKVVGKPAPVMCPKCSKLVPSLLKVGVCRACNWHRRVEKIADERIEVARKTA